MRQSIMSQQPPYGQPSSQPQDYTRQAMHPAVQPEQPKFIARDPELAQPAHQGPGKVDVTVGDQRGSRVGHVA
jgi:hypothetical protein